MPQNTRPRKVNPSLADLIPNTQGVFAPVTPPFVPSPTSDVTDIMAQIQQVLGAPMPMLPQPAPPQGIGGFFQQLLQNLPQALGVGLSAIPEGAGAGSALLQQIAQNRAYQIQQQRAEQERLDRQELLKRTTAVDLLRDTAAERREIAKEGRSFKLFEQQQEVLSKKEREKFDYEKATELEIKKKLREDQLDFEYQNREYFNELLSNKVYIENMPERQKQSSSLQLRFRIFAPELDPDIRERLANKIADVDRTSLTPADKVILKDIDERISQFEIAGETTERELKKAQAEYYREGGSRPSLESQDFYKRALQQQAAKDQMDILSNTYYKLSNGQIVPSHQLPQLPENLRYTAKPLTEEENIQYKKQKTQELIDTLEKGRAAAGTGIGGGLFPTPTAPGGETFDTTTGAPTGGGLSQEDLNYAVNVGMQKNKTPEQMRDFLKINGASEEQINAVLNPPVPEIPTPLSELGREEFIKGKGKKKPLENISGSQGKKDILSTTTTGEKIPESVKRFLGFAEEGTPSTTIRIKQNPYEDAEGKPKFRTQTIKGKKYKDIFNFSTGKWEIYQGQDRKVVGPRVSPERQLQ